ncbi:mechanosensitive ion channel family protein [Aggregatilineales bacterium SYSU G02658]
MLEWIESMPPETREALRQLLLILVVLVVLFVLRRVIRMLLFAPLKRLLERNGSKLGRVIYESFERSSRLLVFAVAIYITVALFEFGPAAEELATTIARALVLISAFVAIYSVVEIIFSNVATVQSFLSLEIEERLIPFLRVVIQVTVVIVGGLIILQEFGINITTLLASFGVVGLALSLAAQDTASNVFSFAAIVSDNPFKVGDFISTKDFTGIVEHVGVRTTRIRRLDQMLVVVPNNALTSTPIVNSSRLFKRRLDFILRVEYDTSSDQLRAMNEAIREMLRARPYTEPDSVVVRFVAFGENALEVRVIANILLVDWNAFTAEQEEINLQILDIIHTLGIRAGQQTLFVMNYEAYEQSIQPPANRQELAQRTQQLRAVEISDPARSAPPSEMPNQPHDSSPLEDPKS